MKRIIIFLFFTLYFCTLQAQERSSFTYIDRPEGALSMDVYHPINQNNSTCLLFVHGGGFSNGNCREDSVFLQKMSEKGYTIASINYRLGMKGVGSVGKLNTKPIEKAIQMAVEDLFAAVSFIIEHAEEWKIDKDKIVICGSSAGAITVLQADYNLSNGMEASQILPEGFHFAGVISFAGAIFSHEGAVDYQNNPAPTMMLHGKADQLVAYKQVRLFRKGLFGSASLVKRFKKFNYPYKIIRYENLGHEVASLMDTHAETIHSFINNYVLRKRFLQIDETIYDPSIKHSQVGSFKPSDLYRKNNGD